MSLRRNAPEIASLRDLYAVAWQIEIDAVARYEMLAAQMETHNNVELARVFRDLARAEGIHAGEIERMAGGVEDIRAHAATMAHWSRSESPESADLAEAHYLMTRAEALRMALAGEERAFTFYRDVAQTAADAEVKALAGRFAAEESGHVELCQRLLRQCPDETRSEDLDPALGQD